MVSEESNRETMSGEPTRSVWRRNWWLLPLIALLALLGVIYVLSQLSTADSEMYPTTMLRQGSTIVRLC